MSGTLLLMTTALSGDHLDVQWTSSVNAAMVKPTE